MIELHRRLNTLLFLVPYVVRHRGVELGDLAARLGMGEDELLREIDFLLMVGRPPFQPNDFLDIYHEGGRVYVDLHQSLEQPPHLTVFEALALACAAQLFAGAEERGEMSLAVRLAVDKVVQSLPPEAANLFDELASHYLILGESGTVPHLDLLRRAVEERREVDMEYYTASRDKVGQRVVRPYGLHLHEGAWYLAAHCLQREARRVFRLSRIRSATMTDRIFDPPAGFDPAGFVESSLTVPASGSNRVVIGFSPRVARWISERWGPAYLTTEKDGSMTARLHDVSDAYVLAYVASFGGEAKILEPRELAERLTNQARDALAKYG